MHVRTILYVLSKVQRLFNLRWIRQATILYQRQSLISDNRPPLEMMG
jgi:hypothetical protein